MLKESEEIVKRRKLSLSATDTATISDIVRGESANIPPGTPPTPPPLNMAMEMDRPTEALALTTPRTSAPAEAGVPEHQTTPNTNNTAGMVSALLANNVTTTTAATIPDHYSLRWNNHQNHLMRAFDALLQSKTLVDVTLVCAETSIRAHKMVLSACSPFFQRVFADTPCKHPVIVLKDFRGWVVQAIIDFMYRGEISVPQERLQTLIQAGESLQIRGLVESSIPEHTPTPAASPDDFGMIDTSLLSPEIGRCSSFDEESPSMVTQGSKIILPSRLFGGSYRREKERKRERELEPDFESDHELLNDSLTNNDLCTSPMPRRKQARPRRRSGELTHDMIGNKPPTPLPSVDCSQNNDGQQTPVEAKSVGVPAAEDRESLDALKTVIKSEISETLEDDDSNAGEHDSGNDSHDHPEELSDNLASGKCPFENERHQAPLAEAEDLEEDDNEEPEDIEELINSTNELNRRRKSALSVHSDGPEDLCTTKKDNDTSGHHSASDNEDASNNNNNSSKLNNNHNNNNGNRIVLSLKDIRQLNKPSSSTPNSASNNLNPFSATSLRDLRLDRSSMENQCKIEALEAQMQAAAACAAAAAANGENPFQHMEHQMDLSLAAAAAAAAVSHQQSRERDHAMQREQREMQQHNAYASSILGQMGMPGMPPFCSGPGAPPSGGPGGPSAHERLEESMNRLSKEFTPTSPMSLPPPYNPQDGPPHPPSPLPFPGMSSALALTPPHMFGLDSPLGLFPPGIDPGKLYNPLMEMSDPRGMPGETPPFLKKKMPRPKGQHSAPRGGPPRSWTNAELTEALQHVWNKKMTTSQASRIFGIPYNSLLMYVRGKYGKSLKLEQLRKDCISGPPLELLQMGVNSSSSNSSSKNSSETREQKEARKEAQRNSNNSTNANDMDLVCGGPMAGSGPRSSSSEPDLLGGPNSLFNPFNPQGFYPDFPGGFPGLPLSMLNLLPPSERQHAAAAAAAMHHSMVMDEDCKSDRSKQSSSVDDEFSMGREDRHRHNELMPANNSSTSSLSQQNGAGQD
ncbi:protein jim lovell isoform X1 [Musca domestica]|uniref:Protein jim lovell isoform X1 n=1 Tax=Musca domestica TaxID=7370 RepID=A0A9J7DE30_MUSDO|nr:protein jim lovell isoform X1 [Musca domestica]XP_019891793.2 protein jim lovell isoform X1 [Musca domestica]XP_019891794.2 protein jim lovell isoform X1 [Musca domestica]XP_019891795.2 protein jim lovell isoform X1 [Musca domestica]XP_058975297.1 protein jim lovell isoform X1 [Musca domestica]XP_058975298.1 protein jim lovell isoform X1 [Musca domestica]